MRVLLDMDGVVADFVSGVIDLHGLKNPYDDASVRGEECWDIVRLLGADPQEFWEPLGYEFWRDLPKTNDCDLIFNKVADEVGEHNVCFLTSPCWTEGCIEGKKAWRDKNFPKIPMLISLSAKGAASPKQFLAGERMILVDDHHVNVQNFSKYGGQAFLVPRPWNNDHRYESQMLERLDGYFNVLRG